MRLFFQVFLLKTTVPEGATLPPLPAVATMATLLDGNLIEVADEKDE